jgi:hypothetical protein
MLPRTIIAHLRIVHHGLVSSMYGFARPGEAVSPCPAGNDRGTRGPL